MNSNLIYVNILLRLCPMYVTIYIFFVDIFLVVYDVLWNFHPMSCFHANHIR